MRFILFVILMQFHSYCMGQGRYRNLLDSALRKNSGLFVSSKPIEKLSLDKDDMLAYALFFKDWSRQVLDTVMLLQIIKNAENMDTSLWKDDEIPFALLAGSRDEIVSKRYAAIKLSQGKKLPRFYSRQINQFNATDPYNRNICYFSRPVFDNSKRFAVVQWDNAHGGLGGGGGILLYKLQDNVWTEVGVIMNWRY